MNLVLDLFTTKEIIIIGAVIGGLIFLVIIFTLLDILTRKKDENNEIEEALQYIDVPLVKKNISEIKTEEKTIDNLTSVKEEVEIIDVKEDDLIIEEIETLSDNNIVINNNDEIVEPLIMDVQQEQIEEITSKEKAKIELEEIEKKLENPISLDEAICNLEADEEENAIISYQELLEKTSELNIVNVDSGDEPISLKEILNMYDENNKQDVIDTFNVQDEMTNVSLDEAYNGDFTSTPLLSPIIGLEGEQGKVYRDLSEIQLENTANLEKLDKEIRKTNEFLKVLNDLKKNLD